MWNLSGTPGCCHGCWTGMFGGREDSLQLLAAVSFVCLTFDLWRENIIVLKLNNQYLITGSIDPNPSMESN